MYQYMVQTDTINIHCHLISVLSFSEKKLSSVIIM